MQSHDASCIAVLNTVDIVPEREYSNIFLTIAEGVSSSLIRHRDREYTHETKRRLVYM